ncbi:MAG: bifunctional 5,10-methylenetetrahydrofolate dehydrogenase/5,10-methenyltetrahydrofolate cyclohydrolase [Clostridiales bacterium]|nr:bifunctional 5,10-methylenetetrahydrofolate dehydrogenase/5,10-methenyltetrahydrofolate cyclohydrolase [Clostridiales bacterium]
MLKELHGDIVKEEIDNSIISSVTKLNDEGIIPKIAIIRAKENSGLIYYEKAILRQCKAYNIESQLISFPEDVSQKELENKLHEINMDKSVHGIILLRPFPSQINEDRLNNIIHPSKDIDAVTDISIAGLFTGKKDIYLPCTANSCMEFLKHYGISVEGKKVTIIGRSLTVGKPLSVLMLAANATVTVCHSKTTQEDQIAACKNADIVVLATGKVEGYGTEYFRDGQIVLDVGTGTGKDGKMHGDLDMREIQESDIIKDFTYTPVPGGIGKVTTAILLRNIIKSAGMYKEK